MDNFLELVAATSCAARSGQIARAVAEIKLQPEFRALHRLHRPCSQAKLATSAYARCFLATTGKAQSERIATCKAHHLLLRDGQGQRVEHKTVRVEHMRSAHSSFRCALSRKDAWRMGGCGTEVGVPVKGILTAGTVDARFGVRGNPLLPAEDPFMEI